MATSRTRIVPATVAPSIPIVAEKGFVIKNLPKNPRKLEGGAPSSGVLRPLADSYLNLKSAVCSLPSFNFTTSTRQVPAHELSVFQL